MQTGEGGEISTRANWKSWETEITQARSLLFARLRARPHHMADLEWRHTFISVKRGALACDEATRRLSRSWEHGLALVIRKPDVDELPGLSELCLRSKAVWGYDEEFIEACRGELSFSPQDLEATHVAVAEEDHKILGVVQVRIGANKADLLKLFVEPEVLRKGTGQALFAWAIDVSRRMGAHQLMIEADPDAVPFYRRMGARDAGMVPSGSIPGRMLPRLTFDVLQSRT